MHHPPAVGARPQVRRDHARHARTRASRTATRSRSSASRPTAGRVRRVREHVRRRRRAPRCRRTCAASATRSRAAARAQPGDRRAAGRCCATSARSRSNLSAPDTQPQALLRRARRRRAHRRARRRGAGRACSSTSTPRSPRCARSRSPFIQDSITEGAPDARRGDPRRSRTSARSCATRERLFRELRPGRAARCAPRRPTSPTRSRSARARCAALAAVQPPARLAAPGAAARSPRTRVVPRGIKRPDRDARGAQPDAADYLAPAQTPVQLRHAVVPQRRPRCSARATSTAPGSGSSSSPRRRGPTTRARRRRRPPTGPTLDNHLHSNPYPNTASPGQPKECEAGNEPYAGRAQGDRQRARQAAGDDGGRRT